MAYDDPTTGEQREGDVLADFPWWHNEAIDSSYVEVVVECKSGKSHPWVAFYGQDRETPKAPRLWFLPTPGWEEDEARRLDMLTFEWVREEALRTDRVATHVVSALGRESANPASNAVRQVLSFAVARSRLQRFFRSNMASDNRPAATGVVVPVVVTQAPLFACRLGSDDEIEIKPVDRFDVWASENNRRRRVYVRGEATFADMAGAISRVRTAFSEGED
ncbi:hypothetical protein [Nocardioides hungaricus]